MPPFSGLFIVRKGKSLPAPAAVPLRVERKYSRLAFVVTPSAELGHVAEAVSLHVLIGDLHD